MALEPIVIIQENQSAQEVEIEQEQEENEQEEELEFCDDSFDDQDFYEHDPIDAK